MSKFNMMVLYSFVIISVVHRAFAALPGQIEAEILNNPLPHLNVAQLVQQLLGDLDVVLGTAMSYTYTIRVQQQGGANLQTITTACAEAVDPLIDELSENDTRLTDLSTEQLAGLLNVIDAFIAHFRVNNIPDNNIPALAHLSSLREIINTARAQNARSRTRSSSSRR